MIAKYFLCTLRQRCVIAIASAVLLGIFSEIGTATASASNAEAVDPILVRKGKDIIVPPHSPLRERLVVAPVTELTSPHTLKLPGIVEADPSRIVNILPPLTGRLTELKVSLGDKVKQGEILSIIHSPDLDQAYSDVDKARDALNLASKALERARGVHEAGGNTVKDLEQLNSTYEQALAESKRAEARLNTLKGSNDESNARVLTINAPVSGSITALNNGNGAYLNDVTATLMTITNLDYVWVTAYVPENLVAFIDKGQAVDVYLSAYPSKKFHGTISFISTLLDSDTHRNKARIAFANTDGKLKPNMYATVHIEVPQPKHIVVPLSALLMNNDDTTVFVEVAPWTFERRVVELGREDDENVRILSGLVAGDRIVIRGGVLLND